ncbi:MAG: ABC transporter substrate-binding protein [Blastocatellia bacterium]
MKRTLAVALITCLFVLGACAHKQGKNPSGVANPGFQGAVPEDVAQADCVPGTYGGTLVIGTPHNPQTFNMITALFASSTWVIDHIIFNSIVGYDNYAQKVAPELAKSWEASPDGLTWTIHLRKGVRWSDGAPFNCDDVIFSYQVMSDPEIASPERNTFVQSDGTVPVIEKVDDYTFRFHLKDPADMVPALNDFHPIPKHKWESVYKAGNFRNAMSISSDPSDVVGTGPYRLVSFKADQQITLERNPYYWKVDSKHQRLPYIDRVVFLIVPDNNTWNLKMENGDIDLYIQIQQGVDEVRRFETKGDYKVYDLGPSLTVNFLAFNQDTGNDKNGKHFVDPVKLKWFRDVKFRQAVEYAIDRDAIIRTALNGRGKPIWTPDSPAIKLWAFDPPMKRPYNPEIAKELLKEIGIYDRNGDGIAEDGDGHPVKFSLMTNSNNSVRVNMVTLIKENLKNVGLDVNLDLIDPNLMSNRMQFSRDFDAMLSSWQAGVPPDPIEGKDQLLPTGESYAAFPRQKTPSTEWEKQLLDLLNKSMGTNDLANRQKYYRQAMQIWTDYLPEIDLVSPEAFAAAKNSVGNLKPSALPNFVEWNIDELYFKY